MRSPTAFEHPSHRNKNQDHRDLDAGTHVDYAFKEAAFMHRQPNGTLWSCGSGLLEAQMHHQQAGRPRQHEKCHCNRPGVLFWAADCHCNSAGCRSELSKASCVIAITEFRVAITTYRQECLLSVQCTM